MSARSGVPGVIPDIILIGPVRTGKSTLGKLLAEKLGLPQVSLDDLRWKYYGEIGYDEDLAQEFRKQGGFLALVLLPLFSMDGRRWFCRYIIVNMLI